MERNPVSHVDGEESIWTKFLLKAGPTTACCSGPAEPGFVYLQGWRLCFIVTCSGVWSPSWLWDRKEKQQTEKISHDQKTPKTSHFHVRNFLYSTFIPFSLILILSISERNFALSSPGHSIQLKRAARSSLCILFISSTNSSQPHLIVHSSPLAILVTPLRFN